MGGAEPLGALVEVVVDVAWLNRVENVSGLVVDVVVVVVVVGVVVEVGFALGFDILDDLMKLNLLEGRLEFDELLEAEMCWVLLDEVARPVPVDVVDVDVVWALLLRVDCGLVMQPPVSVAI